MFNISDCRDHVPLSSVSVVGWARCDITHLMPLLINSLLDQLHVAISVLLPITRDIRVLIFWLSLHDQTSSSFFYDDYFPYSDFHTAPILFNYDQFTADDNSRSLYLPPSFPLKPNMWLPHHPFPFPSSTFSFFIFWSSLDHLFLNWLPQTDYYP